MKKKRAVLRLIFATEKNGEIRISRHVYAGITKAETDAIAEELIATYVSKKGVRLKALRRASQLVHRPTPIR